VWQTKHVDRRTDRQTPDRCVSPTQLNSASIEIIIIMPSTLNSANGFCLSGGVSSVTYACDCRWVGLVIVWVSVCLCGWKETGSSDQQQTWYRHIQCVVIRLWNAMPAWVCTSLGLASYSRLPRGDLVASGVLASSSSSSSSSWSSPVSPSIVDEWRMRLPGQFQQTCHAQFVNRSSMLRSTG